MRRGITPIIATVLILMIAVAIAGGAFYWFSEIQSRAQGNVGLQTSQTVVRFTEDIKVVGLLLNILENNVSMTIQNIGQFPIEKGTVVFTIINADNQVILVRQTTLDENVQTNEFYTISVSIDSMDLVVNNKYTVRLTFPNGLSVTADTLAQRQALTTCNQPSDCGTNPCTLYDCIAKSCSYISYADGPRTNCSESIGCSGGSCACLSGYCRNSCPDGTCQTGWENEANCYADCFACDSDSDCIDSNICTNDTCNLLTGKCSNPNYPIGQYTGCTGSTGCSGSICVCFSGSCINTCGNRLCQTTWENYTTCLTDCPFICQENQGSCLSPNVWFTGTITANTEEYCACCGNNGVYDTFYNGTINTTTSFCYTGSYFNGGIDDNGTICSYYNYDWLNGEASNAMGSCCGDDALSDNFYILPINSTSYFCTNGTLIRETIDLNKNYCEQYYPGKWLNNVYPNMYSFTNDIEGSTPEGFSVAYDNINISLSVVDSYQGRFKVAKVSFSELSNDMKSWYCGNNVGNFYSGNHSISFYLNSNINNISSDFISYVGISVNWGSGFLMFGHYNNGTNLVGFETGSHPEFITSFTPGQWYKYNLTFVMDAKRVDVYRDGSYVGNISLPDYITYIYGPGITVGNGNKTDYAYFDSISYDWNLTGLGSCCDDASGEYFDNRTSKCINGAISDYTGAWYSGCSAGNEIVNLDGYSIFSRNDTLLCNCSSIFSLNSLFSNSKFNDGLNSWMSISNPSLNYVGVTTETYAPGSSPYSLNVLSYEPGLQTFTGAGQLITLSDPLTFNFKGAVNETAGFSGVFVMDPNGSGGPTAVYVLYDNAVDGYGLCCSGGGSGCRDTCGGPAFGGGTFVYCINMTNYPSDTWNTMSLNITQDFMTCLGRDISSTPFYYLFGGMGHTKVYYDDVNSMKSNDGYYCDKNNNNGLADGACYNNICIDPYIKGFSGETSFLSNENILVNASLINYSSVSCNLNFSGTNYDMIIRPGYAYYSVPNKPLGTYTANVTCTGINSMSKTSVYTVNFIKKYAEISFTNSTYCLPDPGGCGGWPNCQACPNYAYPAIDEYNTSRPGKEILYALSSPIRGNNGNVNGSITSLLVFSSDLKVINNYTVYNPSYYGSNFLPFRIFDIDVDGLNEFSFISGYLGNNIYRNNFTIKYSGSMTIDTGSNSLVVSDINSTKTGLELIALRSDQGITAYYGNPLYTSLTQIYNYDPIPGTGWIPWSTSDYTGPIVDDIIPGGNLEILFQSPDSNRTHLIDSSGILLYQTSAVSGGLYNISTPTVCNFNSSYPGKEIAAFENHVLKGYNSTLNEIFSYSLPTGSRSYSPVIGDINGDSNLELIFAYEGPQYSCSCGEGTCNCQDRNLTVLNSDGSLIYNLKGVSWSNKLVLSELTSANPGLEIITINDNNQVLWILNSTGNTLYQGSDRINYILTDDINNDSYVEILTTSSTGFIIYKTSSTSTKVWPTVHQNNNNTGCLI